MGSIRFNISRDNLIILNLTVYSETLESSLTVNAVLDTGAARSIIPPKIASNLFLTITKRPQIILFLAFRDLTTDEIVCLLVLT